MATVKKPIKKAANGTTTTKTTISPIEDLQKKKDSIYNEIRKLSAKKAAENAAYLDQKRSLDKQFNEAAKNRNAKLPRQKNGGTVKAKDGKWIQKAVKGMRKDKPCTGSKFGSKTCPPGSKRYNLAKTFKAMGKARKGK